MAGLRRDHRHDEGFLLPAAVARPPNSPASTVGKLRRSMWSLW